MDYLYNSGKGKLLALVNKVMNNWILSVVELLISYSMQLVMLV
jgi:hypothetical protein